jgi:hypothetical protein
VVAGNQLGFHQPAKIAVPNKSTFPYRNRASQRFRHGGQPLARYGPGRLFSPAIPDISSGVYPLTAMGSLPQLALSDAL